MLAIAGGKGGVGRSTTALGLAAALVGQRRDPLVVDADCAMPTLHVVAETPHAGGLAAVARGEPAADAAVESRRFPGVDVLPGSPGADVRRALVALPRDRPVVVDCPAGAGRVATLPVRFADGALVVTTPTPAGVRAAAKTVAGARACGTPVVGVVVTGADAPPAGLAAVLDAPVLATVPIADGRPLDDQAVRSAHDRLAVALADAGWLAGTGRPPDASDRQTAGLHGENP